MNDGRSLHTWAWLSWVLSVLVIVSVTRSPVYLLLTLACVVLVDRSLPQSSHVGVVPLSIWKFAAVVMLLSTAFNAVSVHFGRHTLFELPEWLPLFGGPVTVEAMAYGAISGLRLTGIFAAFTVLNQALPVRALVRFIPRAYSQVAIVVSIAISYVPTTLTQFKLIREAQAVRGHRLRGWRDWLPLFMPLLVGGLERALQLAEAMMSRGFAAGEGETHDIGTRLVMIQGLVAVLAGWLLRLMWGWLWLGGGLMVAGMGLILAALWVVGRRVPHSTYRRERWTRRDTGLVLGAVLACVLFLVKVPGIDRSSVFYYPYPGLTWPGVHPLIGLLLLGLLAPLVTGPRNSAALSGGGRNDSTQSRRVAEKETPG